MIITENDYNQALPSHVMPQHYSFATIVAVLFQNTV